MSEIISKKISLDPSILRLDGDDRISRSSALRANVSDLMSKDATRVRNLVAAVIATCDEVDDDIDRLQERLDGMSVEFELNGHGPELVLHHVPEWVFAHNGTSRTTRLLSMLMNDIAAPITSGDFINSRGRERSLHRGARRSGILGFSNAHMVTTVFGGHKVPQTEYDFARQIGAIDAQLGGRMVTGSGSGMMEAPFEGAASIYEGQGNHDVPMIGITELAILAAEAPNKFITHLLTLPDIEKRMETFLRVCHRLRVHPGGAGTLEEIMFVLATLLHPKNQGLHFPVDLVERVDGQYMPVVENYLQTLSRNAIPNGMMNFHHKTPHDYGEYLLGTNPEIDTTSLWRDSSNMYVPHELVEPFEISFEAMEGLNLHRKDQELWQLCAQLSKFFSALVWLTVKKPEVLREWQSQNQVPLVSGDRDLVLATHDLARSFAQQGRMHLKVPLEEAYRVE
ncbi:MAG: DUF3412 domain-containing protein [Candidatus Peregrinibacteria bacterium]|nr:DUF3412 domain-containing protein [Candidatus Peregrinibacteria bacterium]MDZ4244521.1 DUF3412 domain-containing protein [Candidatus Gracilibacteria bacterium]